MDQYYKLTLVGIFWTKPWCNQRVDSFCDVYHIICVHFTALKHVLNGAIKLPMAFQIKPSQNEANSPWNDK